MHTKSEMKCWKPGNANLPIGVAQIANREMRVPGSGGRPAVGKPSTL